MDAARDLRGERAQVIRVIRLGARVIEANLDLIELDEVGPSLDLRRPGLRCVRQVQAVEAAVDAVPLAERSGAGLCDLSLAELVSHLLQRLLRSSDPTHHHRQRGHEVDEPRKEGPSLQEVVVALDQ